MTDPIHEEMILRIQIQDHMKWALKYGVMGILFAVAAFLFVNGSLASFCICEVAAWVAYIISYFEHRKAKKLMGLLQ